jgi:hypothetical protein
MDKGNGIHSQDELLLVNKKEKRMELVMWLKGYSTCFASAKP